MPAGAVTPNQPLPVVPPELFAQILGAMINTPQGAEALRQMHALLPPPQPPVPVVAEDENGHHQDEGNGDEDSEMN